MLKRRSRGEGELLQWYRSLQPKDHRRRWHRCPDCNHVHELVMDAMGVEGLVMEVMSYMYYEIYTQGLYLSGTLEFDIGFFGTQHEPDMYPLKLHWLDEEKKRRFYDTEIFSTTDEHFVWNYYCYSGRKGLLLHGPKKYPYLRYASYPQGC